MPSGSSCRSMQSVAALSKLQASPPARSDDPGVRAAIRPGDERVRWLWSRQALAGAPDGSGQRMIGKKSATKLIWPDALKPSLSFQTASMEAPW